MDKEKAGYLEDGDGDKSSSRLVKFLVVALIMLAWTTLAIHGALFSDKFELPDFPSGVLYLLGMTLFHSLVHKGIEEGAVDLLTGKKKPDEKVNG